MTDAETFATSHGLEALRAQDPERFAAILATTAETGRLMRRLPEKEAGPAPVFIPKDGVK